MFVCAVPQIDRRMLDFCVGLDTEFSELVDGSHLYTPNVQLDDVILPPTQKELVVQSVKNYKSYMRARRNYGLDDIVTYGAGLVILLHGKSGTGKTMLANSIGEFISSGGDLGICGKISPSGLLAASYLEKKILLINFPSLGVMNADENFRFIFREAKINDALLFFDEVRVEEYPADVLDVESRK
jgi:SpoVK/Ycf46/Vps4 family AAA+-type ATPase